MRNAKQTDAAALNRLFHRRTPTPLMERATSGPPSANSRRVAAAVRVASFLSEKSNDGSRRAKPNNPSVPPGRVWARLGYDGIHDVCWKGKNKKKQPLELFLLSLLGVPKFLFGKYKRLVQRQEELSKKDGGDAHNEQMLSSLKNSSRHTKSQRVRETVYSISLYFSERKRETKGARLLTF